MHADVAAESEEIDDCRGMVSVKFVFLCLV